MGRTAQPLYFVVEAPLYDLEEFAKLREQGHTVLRLGDPAVEWDKASAIVGPRCWRLMPHLVRYLNLLIKEARATMPKKVKNKS